MPRGAKPGERRGGRKAGSRNKRTAAVIEAATAIGMLPHEFLCAISQGQVIDDHVPTFAERMVAADKAAPYYAPKLASVEHSGSVGGSRDATDLTDAELAEIVADETTGGAGAAKAPTRANGTRRVH